MSKKSATKKSKQAKSIVKVPKGKIGRAVFVGSQVAAALSIARTIRDSRAKGDRLALLHGALSAATLIVTVLIAVRTMRAADAETTATESGEPLMLAGAER